VKASLVLLSFLLLSFPSIASAQPTSLDPSNLAWQQQNQNKAAILSDITVGLAIAEDTYESWKSSDRRKAFAQQSLRTTIDVAVVEITKHFVHRQRPDKSDNMSFYSEHTELASMGYNLKFSLSLGAATGYFRIAANKHYLTDTIVGFAAGVLTSRLIKNNPANTNTQVVF
jgi:hypothetical protein